MRIIAIAAVVALTACGSAKAPPSDASLPPGSVVLATFTAEVDPVAGTIDLRSSPTAAGRALQTSLQVLDADVTVANKAGTTFFGVAQGTGKTCNASPAYSGNVWGATVTITNNLTGTTLGGVYAEITSFVGGTGLESCSSSAPPQGRSAASGLWAYPQIAAGATTEVTWIFKYATAAKFSFSGQVVGAKITAGDTESGAQRLVNTGALTRRAVVEIGAYMAVAHDTSGIDVVDKTTGTFVRSIPTDAPVTAMAVASDTLWFGTGYDNSPATSSYVGTVTRSGSWETGDVTVSSVLVDPSASGNRGVFAVVPDLNGRVWVLTQNFAGTSYLRPFAAATGTGRGTETTVSGISYSMALGTDGKLYLPNLGNSVISRFDISADPAAYETQYSTTACAAGPRAIAPAPGGKLYFTTGINPAKVCSIDTAGTIGTVSTIGANYNLYNITVSKSTGQTWVVVLTQSPAAGSVWEVDTSGVTNNSFALFTGNQAAPLALDGNGLLWFGVDGHLWKISM